jgi:hypothetical protein
MGRSPDDARWTFLDDRVVRLPGRCAMRKRLLAAVVAGGMVVVPAPLASAHGGHGSCDAFGAEHVSADAKTLRPSGRLVSEFARLGFIDEHVAADHAALCGSRPS